MAFEVGAAVLSSFLSVSFDRMATREFLNFFRQRNFNHGLIKKLKTKMIALNSLLNDAEEKQFDDPEVKTWLMELKDAAYDAEDVLDEIEYEAQRCKALQDQYSSSSSGDPLTEEIEGKLKEILERLEDLIKNSAVLGLKKKGMEERRPSVNRETTSLPDELDGFFGRDGDKEAIRSLLLSDDANAGNLGVIPIVGMGGIGKTTLAQHVYNDEEVAKQFNTRGWICVSVEFTVLRLTKLILEEVTGRASDSNNLNQLQRNLKGVLDGKKFLLVLDDVWSEDYNGWNKLLTPIRSGAAGSKIVITTRQESVASMVQTVPTHFLKELEDQECWNLFVKHACYDVNAAANPPELKAIGEEIVKKCRGLPLAAKALGGVLRWQIKAEKWTEVLKSKIWDVQNANILPALAVSYIHLPSHLKRCFAYCAIFPQDYEFQKEILVALWRSEGFLVQQKGNPTLEEVGERYFDDLVSRSFFQRKGDYFVMHDLMHDMARFVSGEFCSRLNGETSWKIGERIRHLSYEKMEDAVTKKFLFIHETPFLRSFVFVDKRWSNWENLTTCIIKEVIDCVLSTRKLLRVRGDLVTCFNKEVIDELLPTRKLLRVLFLSCYSIRELPNSICNLKHLRHLDLSCTSITLLPDAVTALFNLEILILRQCFELVQLPADMARLINLCQLDLRGTNLQRMPPEMGKLKKLSKLTDFVVGENGGSSIKELGHLHYLRGEISIRGLQNVKDDRDASEASLKDKENLEWLKLEWKGETDDSRQVKAVLERLQPHMQIEYIEIGGYRGTDFPNWVGDISFSKLKRMRLYGCKNCICLPPLGELASLEELIICGEYDYDAVLEAIGLEFYGMCKPGGKPFSSLKTLEFRGMLNWREWSSFNGAFPVLEELRLTACPELMSVPSHLPSLKRLWLRYCGKVRCISVETFPNLKELDISHCSNLESLWSPATPTTTRPSDSLFSPSLASLHLEGCSKLVSFPRGGLHAPNLKSMIIKECGNLKSLPPGMHSLLPSLEKLSISHCPEIESFPDGGLPSKLQSLEIKSCQKLVGGRMQWDLQSLPCLWSIRMEGESCEEDVESSFPEETLLPSSLKYLEIRCFTKMKSLNYKGLEHLTSLQSLLIGDCKNLESLPDNGLLSSLSSLRIYGCPLLEKRCGRETGEDWPKIRHIPRLDISGI